jgi:predicted RNA-binding protein with PIN domain
MIFEDSALLGYYAVYIVPAISKDVPSASRSSSSRKATVQEVMVYYTDTGDENDELMEEVVICNAQDVGVVSVIIAAQARSHTLRLLVQ